MSGAGDLHESSTDSRKQRDHETNTADSNKKHKPHTKAVQIAENRETMKQTQQTVTRSTSVETRCRVFMDAG